MQNTHSITMRAFSLIEIMIVVSILGILAAITVPQFANSKQRAQQAALSSNVSSINSKIATEFARTGNRPATIDSAWFIGGNPDHAQNSFGVPAIQVVTVDNLTHPVEKVLVATAAGAYWYNTTTGAFCARVTDQGSQAATLEYYNKVNNAEETALGNYGTGGGGGS